MFGYLLIYSVMCTTAIVNGMYWSTWSMWNSCTVTCGQGKQLRQRSCINQPTSDGMVCTPGNLSESRSCFVQGCLDGQWSDWTSWGECSPNTNLMSRIRLCDNPSPSVFGKPCEGVGQQLFSCKDSTSSTQSILFNAISPVDRAPSVGTNIVYGTVITNEGGGYSNRTGIFVAPVTGVYSFYIHLCSGATRNVAVELVAANKIIAAGKRVGENSGCSSTQSVTILHKGDTAKVNVTDTARYGLSGWNSFSGYLVHT